jgi:quercetin dioxygenase-like cupin family protein
MPEARIVPASERAPALNVGGFMINVLASTDQTGGNELFYQYGPEGKGPGPHFHPWDESFYVLQGELHCGVGDHETVAMPGTLIHVPGNTTHGFRFGPGGGALLAITSKGNASKMFMDFDKGIAWESPDRSALVALAAQHGQTIVTG